MAIIVESPSGGDSTILGTIIEADYSMCLHFTYITQKTIKIIGIHNRSIIVSIIATVKVTGLLTHYSCIRPRQGETGCDTI
jgi:hypothetical protein